MSEAYLELVNPPRLWMFGGERAALNRVVANIKTKTASRPPTLDLGKSEGMKRDEHTLTSTDVRQ